jgi:hypothetical protein
MADLLNIYLAPQVGLEPTTLRLTAKKSQHIKTLINTAYRSQQFLILYPVLYLPHILGRIAPGM